MATIGVLSSAILGGVVLRAQTITSPQSFIHESTPSSDATQEPSSPMPARISQAFTLAAMRLRSRSTYCSSRSCASAGTHYRNVARTSGKYSHRLLRSRQIWAPCHRLYARGNRSGGANLGLAAQALHVAHHLLLYSAGISSDINNDGMFLLTAGIAQYQVGNDQAPFVDAPFIRFRFQSSPDYVFLYSEIETTMRFQSISFRDGGSGSSRFPVGTVHGRDSIIPNS